MAINAGEKLSSEKFKTMNHFISVARTLKEAMVTLPEILESGVTPEQVMRNDTAIRLNLVQAAHAVSSAPHDLEADQIIGAVLLGRIDAAAKVRSPAQWDACAHDALRAIGQDNTEAEKNLAAWWEMSSPLLELGFEAMERTQQQNHEIMIEGLRSAAEQSPGSKLRITETIGDTVFSDETILGTASGPEDFPKG